MTLITRDAAWRTCSTPARLLETVRGSAGARKLRLAACACARSVWPLLEDEVSRQAVLVSERHADGLADLVSLRAAHADAVAVAAAGWALWTDGQAEAAKAAVATAEDDAAGAALHAALYAAATAQAAAGGDIPVWRHQARRLCDLLRCVLGNPFQAVTVDRAWGVWGGGAVLTLARAIQEEGRFSDLPVLADALEEAGSRDAVLLDHARTPGAHARGCWVLDHLLGLE